MGQYRLDIVVSDDTGQVAIECDGDRYHGVDQIPADMARQAILERAGWRFVRIRGTRYYRDPDETMQWVFSELDRLQIKPVLTTAEASGTCTGGSDDHQDVLRRAWEIMIEQGWVEASQAASAPQAEQLEKVE